MAEITCSVVKDLLPLYVDDALSPDSRAVVEEHLEGCEGCTEYYHLLKTWERDHIKMKSADDKAVLKKDKKEAACGNPGHGGLRGGSGCRSVLWHGSS